MKIPVCLAAPGRSDLRLSQRQEKAPDECGWVHFRMCRVFGSCPGIAVDRPSRPVDSATPFIHLFHPIVPLLPNTFLFHFSVLPPHLLHYSISLTPTSQEHGPKLCFSPLFSFFPSGSMTTTLRRRGRGVSRMKWPKRIGSPRVRRRVYEHAVG